MNKIDLTYLLGAGASAYATPMVTQIRTSGVINKFAKSLDNINKSRDTHEIGHWEEIATEISNMISIDTLAKKYWVMGNNRAYKSLKDLTELYLTYEAIFTTHEVIKQRPYIKTSREATLEDVNRSTLERKEKIDQTKKYMPIDERNYLWLLNFVGPKKTIPSNVKVLTWNYDNQIPLTLSDIYDVNILSSIKDKSEQSSSEFSLGKNYLLRTEYLNGGIFRTENELEEIIKIKNISAKSPGLYSGEIPKHAFDYFKSKLEEFKVRSESNIRYAWEDLDLTRISNFMKNTSYLVIVGYSFPQFNRQWDEKILLPFIIDSHRNKETKKIVIQNTEAEYNKTVTIIESIAKSKNIDLLRIEFLNHKDLSIIYSPPTYPFFHVSSESDSIVDKSHNLF